MNTCSMRERDVKITNFIPLQVKIDLFEHVFQTYTKSETLVGANFSCDTLYVTGLDDLLNITLIYVPISKGLTNHLK